MALEADTDGGGMIEYTEFLAACMDKRTIIREEVVWEAFRVFDSDGSGTITKKELLKILTGNSGDKIRQTYGSKAVDNFLEEYDVTGDAQIDFDEFMEMLQSVKETFTDQRRLSVSGAAAKKSVVSSTGHSARMSALVPEPSHSHRGDAKSLQLTASVPSLFERLCPCSVIGRGSPESVIAGKVEELPGTSRRHPSSSANIRPFRRASEATRRHSQVAPKTTNR